MHWSSTSPSSDEDDESSSASALTVAVDAAAGFSTPLLLLTRGAVLDGGVNVIKHLYNRLSEICAVFFCIIERYTQALLSGPYRLDNETCYLFKEDGLITGPECTI